MSLPDEPFALKELEIPGRTGPVSESPQKIWGINIAAALGNFPLEGLLCEAGPWGNMAEGDTLTISWGTGQNVWTEKVDKDRVGKKLRMYVPARHMIDGPYAVSYTVKPLGGADEPSEVMQVLVKLTRPGGHDDNGDIGHSKLIMSLPQTIIDGGIHEGNVEDGVPITIGKNDGTPPYPYAAAGDVCRISWGGIYVRGTPLTQEQAEGKAPIIITITPEIIKDAGDAPGVAVVFEVYDKVFNRSEDWSPEQRIEVAVGTTRLGAPLLKETENNVLNVDKLGDADGTVQIIATNTSHFEVGDIPFIRIKGTPIEGLPIDLEKEYPPLTNVPSVVEHKVPNAVLRQLAKAQITLSYYLKKADASPDLRSSSQFIRAIGEVQRLAAPIVVDADSGALDPTLAKVRLEIPFDKSFAENQTLKLFMHGTTPGLKPYVPDLPLRPITHNEIVAAKPLPYEIDGKYLTPVNGGTVKFFYQQLIADTVLATLDPFEAARAVRESIHTEVLQVGEPRLELPEPEVTGVVDGVLPADTDGTTLTVVYRETLRGDEVFMFWIGSITGEYTDSIKLSEFTAGQPVPFPISAELIKGNEGGTVTASYFIKRAAGGEPSYANPLEFSVGVALDLKEPKIKQAPNDTSLDPFAAQDALTAVVDYVGMLLDDKIIVTWTGAAGTPAGGSHTTAPWPVAALGPQEIALDNKVIAFNLGKPVTVSYTVARGTTDPKDSRPRTLAVLPIADGNPAMGMPLITQAANNGEGPEFDVNALTASASMRVNRWPLIALKQYVWLHVTGTNRDDSIYTKTFWQPPASQTNPTWISEGFYTHPMPLVDAQGLKDGSALKMVFKVGLSGSQVEDEALTFAERTYTIKAVKDVKPEITKAEDSKAKEIPHNGGTVDPAVTLTGSAAPNQQVEICEGTVSKGKHPVDGTGFWKYTATLSGLGTRTFTAKADYGTGQVSAGRTFTYSNALTPAITSITDSKDVPIPDNGFTVDTAITLTGTATSRLEVEIFDGTASLGTALVDGTTGKWTKALTGLTLTRHSFKAKALYGANPESAVRTVTVTALIAPTLVNVLDDMDIEVPEGQTTFTTTLKLKGKASNGQIVEIFDDSGSGAVSKGPATAHVATGEWERTIPVDEGPHRLYAKALYVVNPVESNVRHVTVIDDIAPTIDSVKSWPSDDEIPEGGNTVETAVTLSGEAAKGQRVEVFDGANSIEMANVDSSGKWSLLISNLSVTTHSFTAKALYGSKKTSGERKFRVVVPLKMETGSVTITTPWYKPINSSQNFYLMYQREPTQGNPPYTYTSDNEYILTWRNTGEVEITDRGTATITVTDSSNQSASYSFTMAGPIVQAANSNGGSWINVKKHLEEIGYRFPTRNELKVAARQQKYFQGKTWWWSSEGSGSQKYIIQQGTEAEYMAHESEVHYTLGISIS